MTVYLKFWTEKETNGDRYGVVSAVSARGDHIVPGARFGGRGDIAGAVERVRRWCAEDGHFLSNEVAE